MMVHKAKGGEGLTQDDWPMKMNSGIYDSFLGCLLSILIGQ